MVESIESRLEGSDAAEVLSVREELDGRAEDDSVEAGLLGKRDVSDHSSRTDITPLVREGEIHMTKESRVESTEVAETLPGRSEREFGGGRDGGYWNWVWYGRALSVASGQEQSEEAGEEKAHE